MKTMICVALTGLMLTGCSVHRVAGEIAGVDVEASRDGEHQEKRHDYSDNDGFCPPGQAKKGRCH